MILHLCGWIRSKAGPDLSGSKHHLITEAQGIPLALILTSANRNDVIQLLLLVEAIPLIHGKRGRPLSKPKVGQTDRGYDHDKFRRPLHAAGIATHIARRGEPRGSGLGKTRWVVERTVAWLHNFRRFRVRFERLVLMHEPFMKIASCVNHLATTTNFIALGLLRKLALSQGSDQNLLIATSQ
ncbi:transposase [Paraburkholderia sp. WSM4175]